MHWRLPHQLQYHCAVVSKMFSLIFSILTYSVFSERDTYVHVRYMLSAVRLSSVCLSVCRLSVVCDVGAPYLGG